jgi:hypothetical protein
MSESKQQSFLLRPMVIRNIGIVLFVFSFLAPPSWRGGDDFHLFGGVAAFIQTPVFACREMLPDPGQAPSSNSIFISVIMMTAWIANLTIFTRLPFVVGLIAILLPWPAYIYLFSILAGFIPFYPWALGIALIHLSRMFGPRPKVEPRSMWTGF